MPTLATIGYEQANLDDFIATLLLAGVECVLDVRELPLSRKRGFSKKALSEALAAAGLRYVHIKALGDPKLGREAARAGRFAEFRKIYARHLATTDAQAALEQAGELALASKCCLLCFERDPENCHRKVVADSLSQLYSTDVLHLFVNNGVNSRERSQKRRIRSGSGKGGTSPQPAAW
jgi:uncharacterized protein (DUF488 family)